MKLRTALKIIKKAYRALPKADLHEFQLMNWVAKDATYKQYLIAHKYAEKRNAYKCTTILCNGIAIMHWRGLYGHKRYTKWN